VCRVDRIGAWPTRGPGGEVILQDLFFSCCPSCCPLGATLTVTLSATVRSAPADRLFNFSRSSGVGALAPAGFSVQDSSRAPGALAYYFTM
jgi:hypothetical protein